MRTEAQFKYGDQYEKNDQNTHGGRSGHCVWKIYAVQEEYQREAL